MTRSHPKGRQRRAKGPGGTLLVSNRRERLLWLDGWRCGFDEGKRVGLRTARGKLP